jgi:hypothetical protein
VVAAVFILASTFVFLNFLVDVPHLARSADQVR